MNTLTYTKCGRKSYITNQESIGKHLFSDRTVILDFVRPYEVTKETEMAI